MRANSSTYLRDLVIRYAGDHAAVAAFVVAADVAEVAPRQAPVAVDQGRHVARLSVTELLFNESPRVGDVRGGGGIQAAALAAAVGDHDVGEAGLHVRGVLGGRVRAVVAHRPPPGRDGEQATEVVVPNTLPQRLAGRPVAGGVLALVVGARRGHAAVHAGMAHGGSAEGEEDPTAHLDKRREAK